MDESRPSTAECRNCGRTVASDTLDNARWCEGCRDALVRRSARAAWIPAVVVGALYLALLWSFGMVSSRFLMVWLALGVALVWMAYKVARRVFFDVFRNRGVRAPPARSS
jgi:uncharacterized membrane protein